MSRGPYTLTDYLWNTSQSPVTGPPCTLGSWVYLLQLPTVSGDEMGIMGMGIGSNFDGIYLRINDSSTSPNLPQITHRNGVIGTASAPRPVKLHKWHFIVGVCHDNIRRDCYLDGISGKNDYDNVTGMSSLNESYLGIVKFAAASDALNGYLYRPFVADGAWSKTEVRRAMASTSPYGGRGLQSYWPMPPTESGNAIDFMDNVDMTELNTVPVVEGENPSVKLFTNPQGHALMVPAAAGGTAYSFGMIIG